MTFEERFNLLEDKQTLSARMGIKNVAKYFRDQIKNNIDIEDAETRMIALEQLYQTIDQEIKENEYKIKRQFEYSNLDDMLKEALIEKELGNPKKFADYISLRNKIKTKHPKPE